MTKNCRIMESPLISIIVPVYNAESTLNKCIESIIAQSYSNFELILINDGSCDNSLEICKLYQRNDPRIKVIDQVNQGVSCARNNGISISRGKYITFVDSDDWIGQEYLKGFDFFNIDADLYIEGIKYYFPHRQQYLKMFEYTNQLIDSKDIQKVFRVGVPLNGCPVAKLFLREIIINNKLLFNRNFAIKEDHLFVTQYISKTKTIYLSKQIDYFYEFDISKNSLTKKYHSPEKYLKIAEAMNQAYQETYGDVDSSLPNAKNVRYIFGPHQISNVLFSSPNYITFKKNYAICITFWQQNKFEYTQIKAPTIIRQRIFIILNRKGSKILDKLECYVLIKYCLMFGKVKAMLRRIVFG